MRRGVIAGVFGLFVVSLVFLAVNQASVVADDNAPKINPDYEKYLSLSDEEKAKVDTMPSPFITELKDNKFITRIGQNDEGGYGGDNELPASFDLRDVNGNRFITELKNQGSFGLCWAFAAVESAESYLMVKNNKPLDENTEHFSVRQIDYATSNDGIYNYTNENAYRDLTTGGNFYMATMLLANGLGLINDDLMPYDYSTEKKELQEVLSYSNSLYEINETVLMPAVNEVTESYINTIKAGIIEFGGAFLRTGGPGGSCGAYNVDGKYVMEDETSCHNDQDYGGHGMQIIGWDDNYSYGYCRVGSKHTSVNGSRTCDEGELVVGTGVWLVRNSWGSSYDYVYLAYSSNKNEIDFITNISASSEKNWDNNYHANPWKDGMVSTSTMDRKTFTRNFTSKEKLTKIKFLNASMDGVYSITVMDGSQKYENVATINAAWPGTITVDLLNENIWITNDSFTVVVSSSDGSYLLKNSLSVFTKNSSTVEPEIKVLSVTKIDNNTINVYAQTRGVASGAEVNLAMAGTGVVFNKVAENNVNAYLTSSTGFKKDGYFVDVGYGGKTQEIFIDVGADVQFKEVLYGDVSGDGKVSSADYVKIRKHIMETERITGKLEMRVADITKDNKITSADYVKIRKIIMGESN